MRNLLGRLHARQPADLDRIAAFWQVPLGNGPPPARVAAVYKNVVDPRAARSAWARLLPDEQDVVRLLAVADGPDVTPTVDQLAQRLGMEADRARAAAVSLYRKGIVARDGDDGPLPVGTAARVFVPRELALLFRRVLDEIDVGDRSADALPTLLEWLDAGEVEESARRWGVTVTPGVERREDVTRRLIRQMSDPDRIAAAAARLGPDARRIWTRVRDDAGDVPVALVTLEAESGYALDTPRAAQRWRSILEELEQSLLVWHTYRPDGSRWLFVPNEIRAPIPPPDQPPAPVAPAAEASYAPPPRHPDALAWDLLTLLRAFGQLGMPVWPTDGSAPAANLRPLFGRFWNADEGRPSERYVRFLLALARTEGLLGAVEDADGDKHLGVMPSIRQWRDRPFPTLTAALRARWLDAERWIEGEHDRVEVHGVDWPGARRRLLQLLAGPDLGLVPERWYLLDAFAAGIAARDPDLLGVAFVAATARAAGDDAASRDPDAARRLAIAEVVGVELRGPLRWFGVVEVATDARNRAAVRINVDHPTDAQVRATSGDNAADGRTGPTVTLANDDQVVLHRPSPTRVWSLLSFADPISLDRESRFRLSASSIARALAGGFDADQITTFLQRQAPAAVPDAWRERIDEWVRGYRRVRVRPALVLVPDDPSAGEAIAEMLGGRGIAVARTETGSLIVEPSAASEPAWEAAVEAALAGAGFSPLRTVGSSR